MIAWLPELLYVDRRFQSGLALVTDESGIIVAITPGEALGDEKRISLARRAILPGMVNAHSHAFQRVLRGRTEYRSRGGPAVDSFWTWRELMYSAATRLTPDHIFDASRMAFLEMALNGITAVGEFHYLHHDPSGDPYNDPNLLAKEVIRAARDVGLRIGLLRVAYARSGFQTEPNPRQLRFIDKDPKAYLQNLERLAEDIKALEVSPATVWVGVAPHSVRAVPLNYLREIISYADDRDLKVHMHVAEQPAEVSACVEEYGRTPIALLQTEGLLSRRFTAVHSIHVTPKAIASFAETEAMVCACPTTERNLGDGVFPAEQYLKHGVAIALGSDSHAQIDLLEDARELEYHLRLQKLERVVLGSGTQAAERDSIADDNRAETAQMLFDCATINGARSIGALGGVLEPGRPADFLALDLDDPSVAGASPSDLISAVVFSLSRSAIREVVIGGKPIVSEGRHLIQEEVVERFTDLQRRLWA